MFSEVQKFSKQSNQLVQAVDIVFQSFIPPLNEQLDDLHEHIEQVSEPDRIWAAQKTESRRSLNKIRLRSTRFHSSDSGAAHFRKQATRPTSW